MKIKGAEFMEWFDHHFPEGYFWDSMEDMLYNQDGSSKLLPDETYDTNELGYIASEDPDKWPDNLTADRLIKKWRRDRTHEVITIYVQKDRVEEIQNYLKSRGVKLK